MGIVSQIAKLSVSYDPHAFSQAVRPADMNKAAYGISYGDFLLVLHNNF